MGEAAFGHVAEDGAGVGGEELESLGAGGAAAAVEGVGEHDFEVGELEGRDVAPGLGEVMSADVWGVEESFEDGDGLWRGASAEEVGDGPESVWA